VIGTASVTRIAAPGITTIKTIAGAINSGSNSNDSVLIAIGTSGSGNRIMLLNANASWNSSDD
jgi:hypothetical protein